MASSLTLCVLLVTLVFVSAAYRRPHHQRKAQSSYHSPPSAYRAQSPSYHTSSPSYHSQSPSYNRPVSHRPSRYYTSRPQRDHTVIDDCTCFEKGNYYSPVSRDGCRSFTQRTAYLPAEKQKCPYGTAFDVKTCVCNHISKTFCPSYCPRPYHAPARSDSYRTCHANGNIYAQVPGTHCNAFTQATAHLPPQKHYCSRGLQFDLKSCVCNYPSHVKCYV